METTRSFSPLHEKLRYTPQGACRRSFLHRNPCSVCLACAYLSGSSCASSSGPSTGPPPPLMVQLSDSLARMQFRPTLTKFAYPPQNLLLILLTTGFSDKTECVRRVVAIRAPSCCLVDCSICTARFTEIVKCFHAISSRLGEP